MQEHLYKCIVFLFLNYLKKQMSFNHLYLIEQHLLSLRRSAILPGRLFYVIGTREFDSWISEKSTCRSHKTCFFCVKFLVFIYCILLQCVVKYNKGGILHASYYIEI